MTLPTGAISLSQVNVELGRAANAPISLLETAVRNLAGIPSGPIDMYSLRGKSAYTPMTASGVNSSSGGINTTTGPGTAITSPSVNVSGGSGGYTYSWSITSSTGTPTLSSANSQTCTVSKTYSKNGSGSFDAYLQCIITDNTGHTVTVTNVEAYADWSNAV